MDHFTTLVRQYEREAATVSQIRGQGQRLRLEPTPAVLVPDRAL
jgi:hypothetical protein